MDLPRSDEAAKRGGYKSYLLGLLMVIQALNLADRGALGLLMQGIKADLALSDTQLGLLTGISFAIFYSTMGIPIARWADRGNRRTIVTVTCALWSLGVILCGYTRTFLQLLTVRIGVAVGEAGCMPTAQSLISDSFDRSERPRAFARYMLGGPLSVVFGYFCAGWLNQFYGWRTTFTWLGAPGILIAIAAWVSIREPRATVARAERAAGPPAPLSILWSNRTFVQLLAAFSVLYFFSFGVWQWAPAFFVRSHGMSSGVIGTWFALIWGLGGMTGTFLGGEAATRYAVNDERRQLLLVALAVALVALISPVIFLAKSVTVAFACMTVVAVLWSATYGPLFATIQALLPDRLRAMAIAVIMLFANLIGMGIGPLATGALSDALAHWAGQESLRYSLVALCPGYLWIVWHLWRAAQTVERDLSSAQEEAGRSNSQNPTQAALMKGA